MMVEENLLVQCESNGGWDPRITIAQCGDLVRAYLIATQRFVLVYDTLLGPKSGGWLREKALEVAQGRPLLVLNSHADWDHYFGNMCFPDAVIVSSHLCAQRISGEVGSAELAKKRGEHPSCYGDVELLSPSVTVEGTTFFHGGDLTIQVLPTVGHRPDHVALFLPEIRTVFAGDCVEDPIPLVDEDSHAHSSTIFELLTSLETLDALEPEWVLANHAPPQKGRQRLHSNIAYLKELRENASAVPSLESLREALPAHRDWGEFYRQAHAGHLRMAWQQRA